MCLQYQVGWLKSSFAGLSGGYGYIRQYAFCAFTVELGDQDSPCLSDSTAVLQGLGVQSVMN